MALISSRNSVKFDRDATSYEGALARVNRLEAAMTLEDIASLPGNRFEPPRRLNGRPLSQKTWQRAVTGDTALRLAHFFGVSAEFWLNFQSLYELRLAASSRKKAGKSIKALPNLKEHEHTHVEARHLKIVTVYHDKYFAHELTKRCATDSVEKFTAVLSCAQVD